MQVLKLEIIGTDKNGKNHWHNKSAQVSGTQVLPGLIEKKLKFSSYIVLELDHCIRKTNSRKKIISYVLINPMLKDNESK